MQKISKITVFYDGQCGLCSREILYYKKLAPANVFIWDNIMAKDSKFSAFNIPLSEGLMYLHALDQYGHWHKGVSAFILIWKQLKYWKILAYVISLPVLKTITNYAYRYFAKWRFKRLEHCQVSLNKK